MTEGIAGLGRGTRVFYRKDASAWLQGELVSVSGGKATIQVGGQSLTVAADLVVAANPVLQDGIPDVVQLSYLNEPGILYNLEHRYKVDDIYTWAGPVLIALNPCKNLPLYTPELAATYKQAARESVTTLAPHIYLVAAAAFRQMLRNKCSQSLVVSGESGAGKTETTKKAMQYFATLAGGTGVEDQVLETNPILEAFGNAKTLRNHNSSRFGKLIQIHFNGSHHICGATIKTYLLEKSRVAMQLKGERSFHIFYQLVRGASAAEREAFRLPAKVQEFQFLSQSCCYDIAGVDDAAEFRLVRKALSDIGVDAEAQTQLFTLLSGLLWLGNIEFEESGTGDSTKVHQNAALDNAAALLGVSQEALITALTTRRIVAPGEVVIKLLKLSEAVEARNSLAKAIYSAVFNWIVARINARLSLGKVTSGLYIAILDIYGFEQFDRNSFEQLCINYANERLQQQFTHHLFKLEQQEYESEGVDWTKVEFIDNQDCVNVFETMPPKGLGILAVMDSQCKFPRATDTTLHTQLLDALSSMSHFGTNPRVPGSFIVKHYAGAVQYDTTGLLDKNKDTLGPDLIQLMAGSHRPLLAELGAGVQEEAERSTKKGQTVITRFGQQLRELVAELDTTGLHFVRCIKPNMQLKPNSLEPVPTLHQLRCCGVLEVARVAAAGFPTRYRLEDFAARYCTLLTAEEQEALKRTQGSAGPRQVCMALLERFGLRVGQYQIGHTKVFFRPGVLGLVEDRWARMQAAVLAVQAGWRMYRCRSAYLRLRQAAILSQSLWRARGARLAYRELVAQHAAALVVQSAWRMRRERKRFQKVMWAVVTIQTRGYRTWKFGKWLSRAMQERDRVELAVEETRVKHKVEADWFSALRTEYSVPMETVPTALAAWRECCGAGADNLDKVKEALAAWRTSLEAPQKPQMAAAAEGNGGGASAGGAAAAIEPAAAARATAAAPAAPAPRQPVMVMTPAVVTPAVVNRFELAQELAIQVERLNLENVKLQKQLALERSLTQRYQHKCEEQSVTWLEQVRLLQAYIQKCRAMFGDSQLPPMPRQVASATQPTEARSPGPSGGGAGLTDEDAPRASTATPGAVSAARATIEQSAAAMAVGTVAANGVSASTGPPPQLQLQLQHVAASASVETQSTVPNASFSTQTDVLAPVLSASFAVQTEPEPARLPVASASTGIQHSTPSASFATQTEAGPVPPPSIPTSSTATQTIAPAALTSTSTATDADMLPEAVTCAAVGVAAGAAATSRSLGADVASTSSPPPPVSAFASPAAGEQLAGALQSPSASVQSESMTGDGVSAAAAGTRSTALPSAPAPTTASQRYVNKLGEELERVMQVLPDDVSFIREVHEGAVVAPDMDPGVELFKLKKKFEVWKREFKEKLRTTEEVLRKIEHMESRNAAASGGGAGAPTGGNDTLRPSQSVRVVGPAPGTGPQSAASASGGGRVSAGPGLGGALPTGTDKKRAGTSSKLLGKLFSGGNK
ncbi:hypothetical protein HYH02_011447 [Chlamydomonas schloesseri]|uniref:Myosin motor domain-containing protein n=1 Tax=Chlamydomonas schloesseri TaxID=2026947 RepID=A0A835TEY6_9CHLO|nr:hypothetical protein HYH02_011447 [Chlamydomonas schloesseri]|eukprot:KAG2437016.1 hypothetical protein HYH02_011447 [Chlamydomonas schloesseri]